MSETPTSPNRIDQVTVASKETDARTASISPTGTPFLSPRLAPWLSLLVMIAACLPMIPGVPAAVASVCAVVVALGAAVGIVSPGARKQP